jgi:hypothetical protein
MTDSISKPVLRTDISQLKLDENGIETGYIETIGQRKFGDLREQLETLLKSIHVENFDCSAHGACEYISESHTSKIIEDLIPKGDLKVLVTHGNCEGYRIEIMLEDAETFNLIYLYGMKYLSNRDDVWNIAKDIELGIYEGGFGY